MKRTCKACEKEFENRFSDFCSSECYIKHLEELYEISAE